MNILEFMSFDASWFLQKDGLLITGGIIALIIAIVLFVTAPKKKKNGENVDTVAEQAPVVEPQVTTPVENVPIANEPVVMENAPTVNIPQETTPVVEPVQEVTPVVETPVVEASIPEMVVEPTVVPVAPVTMPAVETVVEQPVVETVQEPAPVVVEPVQEATPVVEQPVTPVAIYGGANPSAVTVNQGQEAHRPIYGGADPLENTQPMPKVEHIVPEVTMVEAKPVVEPTENLFQGAVEAPKEVAVPAAPVTDDKKVETLEF